MNYCQFYTAPTADDLETFAKENDLQIHVWTTTNSNKLPRKVKETNNLSAISNMHVSAPYFNEPNEYSLECLELVLNYQKFTAVLGTQQSGNIFECFIQSGWIDLLSSIDLISLIGSDSIDFVQERSIRRKIGIGFEIWSGKYIENTLSHKNYLYAFVRSPVEMLEFSCHLQ